MFVFSAHQQVASQLREAIKDTISHLTREDVQGILRSHLTELLAGERAHLLDEMPLPAPAAMTEVDPFPARHPDDEAVDRFAAAMKQRLAEKRAEGRGGWDDPNECSIEFLVELFEKAACFPDKPVDMGNYAMMLFNRTQKVQS